MDGDTSRRPRKPRTPLFTIPDELITAYRDRQINAAEIGRKLGCDPKTATQALRRAGVPIYGHGSTRGRLTIRIPTHLIDAYRAGNATVVSIASETGYSVSGVHGALTRAGVFTRRPQAQSTTRPESLDDSTYLSVLINWLTRDVGVKAARIARVLGVSEPTVYRLSRKPRNAKMGTGDQ